MLETADTAAVPPLQQAVIAAIASLPAEEQIVVISRRRLQAGEDKAHLYDAVLSAAEKLKRVKPFVLPAEEREEGYKILFDGTSMSDSLARLSRQVPPYPHKGIKRTLIIPAGGMLTSLFPLNGRQL